MASVTIGELNPPYRIDIGPAPLPAESIDRQAGRSLERLRIMRELDRLRRKGAEVVDIDRFIVWIGESYHA